MNISANMNRIYTNMSRIDPEKKRKITGLAADESFTI
jgi:hypothetical protein